MQQIAGMQLFLICEGKLLLILRDDKPDIKDDPINGIHFPNTWALMGGGVEEGENFFQTAKREIKEELGIELDLQVLGVSVKGNCFFFSLVNKDIVNKIVLREGQDFNFFEPKELDTLKLGGAIKIYWQNYREQLIIMIGGNKIEGSELGLFTLKSG